MPLNYITKQEAEEKSGIKLDGRRRFIIWNDEVCTIEKYTTGCSGCLPDDEYSNALIGSGCHECGYTGKRQQSVPAPVKYTKRVKN